MQGNSHDLATRFAFRLLRAKDPALPSLSMADLVAKKAVETDAFDDLEFVNVDGGYLLNNPLDDPHREEVRTIDDAPRYVVDAFGMRQPTTGFNHFIDIEKGSAAAEFDDYDGYAYERGSASKNQCQSAALDPGIGNLGALARALCAVTGAPLHVDAVINWWLNDEYVHAPGSRWYRTEPECSPCVRAYSRFYEMKRFPTLEAEAAARFPASGSVGVKGKGIPYSVFLPVDNLALAWLERFRATADAGALGPVFHAFQDACIPQHAAGCNGNWHSHYEREIDANIASWLDDPLFVGEVEQRFAAWWMDDPTPPRSLDRDGDATPARSWPVDMLVTWLAIRAWREYRRTYRDKKVFSFDATAARELTADAVALSLVVLAREVATLKT